MKVLVLDGNSRVTLAVVRSLGRRGCQVDCAEDASIAAPLAFRSRYVRRRMRHRRAAEEVIRLSQGHDVVLATATRSLQLLADNREEIEAKGTRVPIPRSEDFRMANDKLEVGVLARTAGIATPGTLVAKGVEEVEQRAPSMQYPVIVKLRADQGADLSPGERYRVAQDERSLCEAWRALSRLQPFPLIQRRVEGSGLGVGILMNEDSEVLAKFSHLRERELPPAGGPSTACISTHAPEAEEAATALLEMLGWSGVAMVEFRIERGTGVPYLLEVNPRFWGSIELPIRCGIDFPWLLCRWAMGEKVEGGEYPDGRRLRFLAMDAAATAQALGDPEKRWKYLGGFLRDLVLSPPDGILSSDDPSPGYQYLSSRLSRMMSRCGSSL